MTLKFLCPPISTMNTNHGILKYHLFNHNDLDDTITSSFYTSRFYSVFTFRHKYSNAGLVLTCYGCIIRENYWGTIMFTL